MRADVRQPESPVLSLSASPPSEDVDLLALGFTGSRGDYTLGLGADGVLAGLGVDVFALLDGADATGRGGEVVRHQVLTPASATTILLVGLGSGSTTDYRRAGAAIIRAARSRSSVATAIGSLADDEQLAALVEGLVLGGFGFRISAAEEMPDAPPGITLTGVSGPVREAVVEQAVVRAHATWRARSFALTPSDRKGPARLEEWAREAAAAASLDVEVWDDERLAAEGFGGILAVGSGSAYDSRFVRLDYTPEGLGRLGAHVVLVGKGITFDTGGISIKPNSNMMTMKRDMTGAGVVIAVMGALRELGVQVGVTGLVASAENAFGGASMRPGDVVTHYGGRTSEVGNTDAEGRLVLADALAYADANIESNWVVDIATLTGAGRVALGTSMGALLSNDDQLAEALFAAGDVAGEPVWRLPLRPEYEPLLENTFADATNAAGGPGAITAGLFLQHFVGSTPWAHLDIASVGDSPTDAFEYTKGATGFGARLLLRWLAGL